jgi:hypothetical protein
VLDRRRQHCSRSGGRCDEGIVKLFEMIVAQLMLVCSVVKYSGVLGLHAAAVGGNDVVPDREAGGHLGSPLGCTDQMTMGPKVLPDVAESKQEPLSLPR